MGKYTKREIGLLTENYISNELDADVDSFLFNFANIMGFSSVDILKFFKNANDEAKKSVIDAIKVIKHIKDPDKLRTNDMADKITSILKTITDGEEIHNNGTTEPTVDPNNS